MKTIYVVYEITDYDQSNYEIIVCAFETEEDAKQYVEFLEKKDPKREYWHQEIVFYEDNEEPEYVVDSVDVIYEDIENYKEWYDQLPDMPTEEIFTAQETGRYYL